jgi:hypothetical protein
MPYQMGQAYFHQAANLIGSIPGMFNLTHTGPGPVTYQGQTYWSDGMKIGMVDPAWTKPGFSIEYNFDAMSDQNLINGVDEVIKGNSPSFEGLAGPRPAIEPGQLGKQLTFARDAYTDYLEASTRYQQAMHTPTTSFRQLLEAGDDMERATIKLQSAGWMFQGMPRPIN